MSKLTDRSSVEVVEVSLRTPPLQMPDTVSAAEDTLNKALAVSARRMGLDGPEAVQEALKRADARAFRYTSHELACQLAQTLAALDRQVKAVYVFEDYATPEDLIFAEDSPTLAINLIAWVDRKTKALAVLAQGLDRALAERCNAFIAPERGSDAGVIHVLDVQLVDDHDVRMRVGYGALLTSVHHPPIQVWKR